MMKIPDAAQLRAWDQYTILHEPIASIDLMERAATRCVEWLELQGLTGRPFSFFCGKGNNGGDGLAMARMLMEKGQTVTVNILEFGHKGTEDFQTNLARLHQNPRADIHFIQDKKTFHPIDKTHVIIDALFGSGLSRPLEGLTADLVEHINRSGCPVISIDIPSGLSVDSSSRGHPVILASHTLGLQCYKPAFLVAENSGCLGQLHILNIGLHPDFYQSMITKYELTDLKSVRTIYKARNRFAHKGNFGHALLVAGSYGKMGAAVLASGACLRSGVGLLTAYIPQCGYDILQTGVPEAMAETDPNVHILTSSPDNPARYDAIGIGPGAGTASETRRMLKELLAVCQRPVVIDADALNCLSMEKELAGLIPPGSILTPHPKEFERLFGPVKNDFDRVEKSLSMSQKMNCIIILKGHHTFIATPGGHGYFNSTGNAGMATAGSGDVLTGLLTGLLAQGYAPEQASVMGVYLHGLAGDLAAANLSEEAMLAGDIVDRTGSAFQKISEK